MIGQLIHAKALHTKPAARIPSSKNSGKSFSLAAATIVLSFI